MKKGKGEAKSSSLLYLSFWEDYQVEKWVGGRKFLGGREESRNFIHPCVVVELLVLQAGGSLPRHSLRVMVRVARVEDSLRAKLNNKINF